MIRYKPNIRLCLFFLTILTIIVTLYFGLRFRGFRILNNVIQSESEAGIRFDKYGIAYSIIDNQKKETDVSETDAFTLEIAFETGDFNEHGFNILFSIHNGKDSEQLIVGQWKSHLIIMNGDDYPHKRKTKRISADIHSYSSQKTLLTVTTGKGGTSLFLNGVLIKTRPDFTLKIPEGPECIVTLGNTVYGKHSWQGRIYSFSLYKGQIENEKPYLFVSFEKNKKVAFIASANVLSVLKIPEHFMLLKKQILSLSWDNITLDKNLFADLIINFIGFIPLGFILAALLMSQSEIPQKRILLISVTLCFLLSLFIEIIQAWIPSRSSQLVDLVLNTVGGYTGSLASVRLARRLGGEKPEVSGQKSEVSQ